MRPTRFVHGPEGESQWPEYPWVLKGPEPKDFLGNEFALWLWNQTEAKEGVIETSAGDVSILIDRSLDLDCAYGQTGKDSLRATGPSRMPEARDAIRTGKLPRKAGIVMDVNNIQYSFTLNFETFAVGTLKLPDIEGAETPRVVFEERIALLRDVTKTLDAMFETFLSSRAGSSWEGQTSSLRRWALQSPSKAVAAVA